MRIRYSFRAPPVEVTGGGPSRVMVTNDYNDLGAFSDLSQGVFSFSLKKSLVKYANHVRSFG
jgi:hypothetical protein